MNSTASTVSEDVAIRTMPIQEFSYLDFAKFQRQVEASSMRILFVNAEDSMVSVAIEDAEGALHRWRIRCTTRAEMLTTLDRIHVIRVVSLGAAASERPRVRIYRVSNSAVQYGIYYVRAEAEALASLLRQATHAIVYSGAAALRWQDGISVNEDFQQMYLAEIQDIEERMNIRLEVVA